MRKFRSKSERDYERAYRELRLYGEEIYQANNWRQTSEAQDCAGVSYDTREELFTGWTNNPRKYKFYDGMATNHPLLWFPF